MRWIVTYPHLPFVAWVVVSRKGMVERASPRTPFPHGLLMMKALVVAGRNETRQAGIDPAREPRSRLFQYQRHRSLPRIKADDPFLVADGGEDMKEE